MQLKQSERKQVKLRLGLSGASGFGKTKSALLLAYGMTGDWSKIAVIDTENSSASLYSDLGNFKVLDLSAPYSPERYIQAIDLCEKSNISVIIIDSASHEWNGSGGCLDIHEKLGGRFQDWANVTPRHQAFIDKILQSQCHIITTTRRKMDYSLDVGSNGKTQVVKHGTKEITRDGFEYELTVNFELINENHLAKASKDRTSLFANKPEFVITIETGRKILEWCNSGTNLKDARDKIKAAKTVDELKVLYNQYSEWRELLEYDFKLQKDTINSKELLLNPKSFSTNGHANH